MPSAFELQPRAWRASYQSLTTFVRPIPMRWTVVRGSPRRPSVGRQLSLASVAGRARVGVNRTTTAAPDTTKVRIQKAARGPR
jgi:hypothetical protein